MPPIKKNIYTKKVYDSALTATQRKQVQRLIKKADKANSANRRFPFTANQTLLAGKGYSINPLAQIAIGSGISNREANMIMVDSIDVNLTFTNNNTALSPNMRWMFMAFLTDEELLSPSASFFTVNNSGLQTSLPLIGNSAGGFCTQLMIDPNRARKVIYKRSSLDTKVSTIANEYNWSHRIPMRGRKFKYLSDTTGSFMDGQNLFFAVIADANGATVDTTNVGIIAVTYKVNFH